MVEVQTRGFLCFFDMPARPSAGIGVVEVQKLEVLFAFFAVYIPAAPAESRKF